MSRWKREVEDFYSESYSKILETGAVGKLNRFVHSSLELPFGTNQKFCAVLEVGAGAGQHIEFVKHQFESYVESDIREMNLPSRSLPNVKQQVLDAVTLEGVGDVSVDRLIATCVLAHLPNPEQALAQWDRVVKPGGHLSIFLPADPGLTLRLARSMTTARKARKLGYDYKTLVTKEHRYQFDYLKTLILETFASEQVEIRSFPLRGFGWNFALWFTAQISKG